jgi:hypothetical protein
MEKNEHEYQDCTIVLAPSYTDTGAWTCGWTIFEAGQESMAGYVHGPFTTMERARRAALREAQEAIDHRMKPR